MPIINLSATNSLVSAWIMELRDVEAQGDRMRFRMNLERIGAVAAYEISKTLPYRAITVQTPMGAATGHVPAQQPVVATILRAGLPLHSGLLQFFDRADSAFIGAYRRHAADGSFDIAQGYLASPALAGRVLIVADTMLATGASLARALDELTAFDKPDHIHIVAAIASTAGIRMLTGRYPDIHIWAGAIDNELTAQGYIVPGLGDAGDLAYGLKRQQ